MGWDDYNQASDLGIGGRTGSGQHTTNQQLLRRYAIASYTPEGWDDPLFANQADRLAGKIGRRKKINLDDVPEVDSLADVLAMIPGSGMGAVKTRQRIKEQYETYEAEKRKAAYDEALALAKTMLDDFLESNDYETLLSSLRGLPETISDEDVQRMRRNTAQIARSREVAALRQERALSGIGGTGGGSQAARAERAANQADLQVTSAFNQIAMEKMQTDRADTMQRMAMEAEIMGRQEQRLSQLQNYYNSLMSAGADRAFMVTAPADDFSAYAAARNTAASAFRYYSLIKLIVSTIFNSLEGPSIFLLAGSFFVGSNTLTNIA